MAYKSGLIPVTTSNSHLPEPTFRVKGPEPGRFPDRDDLLIYPWELLSILDCSSVELSVFHVKSYFYIGLRNQLNRACIFEHLRLRI